MSSTNKHYTDEKELILNKYYYICFIKSKYFQVIACEPLGCLVDQKGNKITGFDSDKKQVP